MHSRTQTKVLRLLKDCAVIKACLLFNLFTAFILIHCLSLSIHLNYLNLIYSAVTNLIGLVRELISVCSSGLFDDLLVDYLWRRIGI